MGALLEKSAGSNTLVVNERIPLIDVPLERNVDSRTKHVAGHELNHALVAYMMGISVEEITVIPDGDILGKTVLSNASYDAMQIIAAAGSVETHDGQAMGFGSDMYQVHAIGRFHDGLSAEKARSEADKKIRSFSTPLREKMAEILAHMGSMSGTSIPQLIERAQFELRLEERRKNPNRALDAKEDEAQKTEFSFIDLPSMFDEKEPDGKEKETIVMETKVNGVTEVTWIKNDKVIRKETVCQLCKGLGTHFAGCPTLKAKLGENQKPNNLFSPEAKSKDKSVKEFFPVKPVALEKEGSIFDRQTAN